MQIPLPLSPNASAADLAALINLYAGNSPLPGVFNFKPGGLRQTRLALSNDCPLVDATVLFNGARSWVTSFYSDTKHLNAAGYNDIGAAVSRVLQLAA